MARFKGRKNGKACTLEIQGRKLRMTPKGCGVDDWVVFKASDVKYRDPYYRFKGKILFDPASHETWRRLHEYLGGKLVYRGGRHVKVSIRKKSRKGKSKSKRKSTRKSRKSKSSRKGKKKTKRKSKRKSNRKGKKKSKRKSRKGTRKTRKSKSKSKKRKRKSR